MSVRKGKAFMVASTRSSHIAKVIGASAVCACCTIAMAQPAQPPSPPPAPPQALKSLVADLGSTDIWKREQASAMLVEDRTLTLSQLEELLKDPGLSQEQRCRISQAAKDRFLSSPRPALGIQFDQSLPDRAAISKIYSQFPASKFLEPGDIIVAVNGEKLRTRSASLRLGAHIFSAEPGDRISLVVRRGSQKLNLDVELGYFNDLEGRSPTPERLIPAWELRSSRFSPAVRQAIVPNAEVVDWRPEPTHVETQKIARSRSQMPQLARTVRVVAGGEARGGALNYDELLALQSNPRDPMFRRIWEQQGRAQLQIQMQGWPNAGIHQTTAQEINMLEGKRLELQRRVDEARLPGVMKPEQLAQREREMQFARDELARIRRQIEAIRAEAAEELAEEAADAPPDAGSQGGR